MALDGVSSEKLESFITVIKEMAKAIDLDRSPEIMRRVEMLIEEAERESFQRRAGYQKKKKSDIPKFIQIFKTRYLELTDLEYDRPVSPSDGKLVKELCFKLEKHEQDVDCYLKWLFNDWLPENEKFIPPNLKTSCSQFIQDRFFYEFKDKIKNDKAKKCENLEGTDLINRAKVLIRTVDSDEVKVKIRSVVSDFANQQMALMDFKKAIENFEKNAA